jgi:type I restriction enzyme M protein
MSIATHDIVAKLWNLCNVLKDGGVTYHEYAIELTYLLFLKMAKETSVENQIPAGYRWDELTNQAAPEQFGFYKELLSYLGGHGSVLVQEIFADARSAINLIGTVPEKRTLGMCMRGYWKKMPMKKRQAQGSISHPVR